jgi:hypothetical protein
MLQTNSLASRKPCEIGDTVDRDEGGQSRQTVPRFDTAPPPLAGGLNTNDAFIRFPDCCDRDCY